jgi:hypothetical protein
MILENELRYLEVGGPGILVAGCLHQPHAVMLQEYRRVHTLTIWSIDSSQQITYRCQLDFTGEGLGVCVDLYYISVLLRQQEEDSYTIHFISTTTLNMERSLSTHGYMPSYFLNGILALSNEIDCIR